MSLVKEDKKGVIAENLSFVFISPEDTEEWTDFINVLEKDKLDWKNISQNIPQNIPQNISQNIPQKVLEEVLKRILEEKIDALKKMMYEMSSELDSDINTLNSNIKNIK
jgi:membrane-associated HD superfamily phosphohydrolase